MHVSMDRRPSVEKARFERANSMRPHLQCGAFDQLSHFSLFMLPTIGAYSRDSIGPSDGVPPLGAARGYPMH